ncbi:MAG: succinylglutamate desuccinylase/aspartoacylase family protein, partial [bacterium]
MNKKTLTKINIGNIGVVDLNIPVLKIGSENPRVLLICGIHGNETSGLFVINQLLSNLPDIKGTLCIITSANPLAQALKQRENLLDLRDLNRVFPGDRKNEGISQIVASKIFTFAKEFDFVIDLHTFPEDCPVVAIAIKTSNKKVTELSETAIKAFNPDIVWELQHTTKREAHFVGALGVKLAEAGVANFAVEMPPLE